MKKKYFFYIAISLFIFSQTKSFSQNIFDDLKKATDQIQKDLGKTDTKPQAPSGKTDSKSQPPAESSSQKKTEDTKTSTTSKSTGTSSSSSSDFNLFGVKLGDQIANIKTDNKAFTKDSDIPFFRVNAHVLFTPTTKNELFDQYVLSYGPISKKIFKISGKLKKEYKAKSECEKDFKDIYKFVAEKNLEQNKSAIKKAEDITGQGNYLSVDGYQMVYVLKEEMYSHSYDKTQGKKNIDIRLNGRCIKYGENKFIGWLELRNIYDENNVLYELADLKQQKEQKDFEQKKGSGQLKGL